MGKKKKDNTKEISTSSTSSATTNMDNNTNQSITSTTSSVSELTNDEPKVISKDLSSTITVLPPIPNSSPPVRPDEAIPNNHNDKICPSPISKDLFTIPIPIPISPLAKIVFDNLTQTYATLTTQEKRIVDSCEDILIRLLPHLTLDVYEGYIGKIQFALAESQALALYNNAKHSELARETSKIVSAEQSVNAPIVKSMINEGIDFKLKQLQNKIDNLTKKNRKAKEELKDLKGQACSENQLQTASHLVTSKVTFAPPTSNESISSVSTSELMPPTPCLKRKLDEKNPSTSEEEAKRKERKRLRNQRQRTNRLKRKESQGATPNEKTKGSTKP